MEDEVSLMKNYTVKLVVLDRKSETKDLELNKGFMRMTNKKMLIDRGWQGDLEKERAK